MLHLTRVTKSFPGATGELAVLREVSFTVPSGQFVAIVGPSGSGKSTLLGIMAGLDRPSGGSVVIDDIDLTQLSEDALATVRNERIGYIFQSFQLLSSFTARENVAVPLELRGVRGALAAAAKLLREVGLGKRLHHTPLQLSGGEQQRVAVARALVGRPAIVFADEPTGNLDSANGTAVLELLERLVRERGATLVLVTHDPAVAARADRILELRDGRLVADSAKKRRR